MIEYANEKRSNTKLQELIGLSKRQKAENCCKCGKPTWNYISRGNASYIPMCSLCAAKKRLKEKIDRI